MGGGAVSLRRGEGSGGMALTCEQWLNCLECWFRNLQRPHYPYSPGQLYTWQMVMTTLADQSEFSSSLMWVNIKSDSLSLLSLSLFLPHSHPPPFPYFDSCLLFKQSTGFPYSWGPGGLSVSLNKLMWNWSSRVGTRWAGVSRAFPLQ